MSRASRIGMATTCLVVAVLSGVAALLGVFARGTGASIQVTSARGETYAMATGGLYAHNAQRVVAEGVGWDIVTLVIVIPALLLVLPRVAAGSFRGRLFGAGLLGYFLYQYLEYSVTWALGPLFPLFVAITAASVVGLSWIGWSLVAEPGLDAHLERFPRRAWATLNLLMSALLTVMWIGRIAAAIGDGSGILLGETTLTVQALDLGLVVPLSAATSVLVLRRDRAGYALGAAYGVMFAAMSLAITGMLLSAWAVEGTLEIVPVAIFGLAALSAIVLVVRTYATPSHGSSAGVARQAHALTG